MRFPPIQHMRRSLSAKKSALQCSGAVLALLAASPQAGRADDLLTHPVDRVLKALDLKTDVGPAPDFVQASRPKTEGDFVSVGTQHPTRTIKVKSADELKAMETELDAARVRHDKLAGRKPAPEATAKKALPAATQN